MPQKEAQQFLLEVSKEIAPMKEIQNCRENILTMQLIRFNVLLSILLIAAFFIDVFSYGALIGIGIITGTMYYRIRSKKPKYLKEMKKLFKELNIGLMHNNFGDEMVQILKLAGNRFVIDNLIVNVPEELSIKAKCYISDYRFSLTYNEIQHYLKTIDNSEEEPDIYYRSLKEELEENKEILLSNTYKNF